MLKIIPKTHTPNTTLYYQHHNQRTRSPNNGGYAPYPANAAHSANNNTLLQQTITHLEKQLSTSDHSVLLSLLCTGQLSGLIINFLLHDDVLTFIDDKLYCQKLCKALLYPSGIGSALTMLIDLAQGANVLKKLLKHANFRAQLFQEKKLFFPALLNVPNTNPTQITFNAQRYAILADSLMANPYQFTLDFLYTEGVAELINNPSYYISLMQALCYSSDAQPPLLLIILNQDIFGLQLLNELTKHENFLQFFSQQDNRESLFSTLLYNISSLPTYDLNYKSFFMRLSESHEGQLIIANLFSLKKQFFNATASKIASRRIPAYSYSCYNAQETFGRLMEMEHHNWNRVYTNLSQHPKGIECLTALLSESEDTNRGMFSLKAYNIENTQTNGAPKGNPNEFISLQEELLPKNYTNYSLVAPYHLSQFPEGATLIATMIERCKSRYLTIKNDNVSNHPDNYRQLCAKVCQFVFRLTIKMYFTPTPVIETKPIVENNIITDSLQFNLINIQRGDVHAKFINLLGILLNDPVCREVLEIGFFRHNSNYDLPPF